jgi:hypothetical protein
MGKQSNAKQAAVSNEASALKNPLFFGSPYPLSHERHQGAGVSNIEDYTFAQKTNSVPVNLVEFLEIAVCYPIVFTEGEQTVPLAVVGLADGLNRFVDEQGVWNKESYIPAYVRKYPFVLMEVPEKQFLLCVDEDSARVMKDAPALPFYKEDGSPAPVTEGALQFCRAFQQEYERTLEFCNALKDAELLTSRRIAVHKDGEVISALQGFLVLDEQKLAQLSEETIREWQAKGWMFYIHAVLISMANWKRLAAKVL